MATCNQYQYVSNESESNLATNIINQQRKNMYEENDMRSELEMKLI